MCLVWIPGRILPPRSLPIPKSMRKLTEAQTLAILNSRLENGDNRWKILFKLSPITWCFAKIYIQKGGDGGPAGGLSLFQEMRLRMSNISREKIHIPHCLSTSAIFLLCRLYGESNNNNNGVADNFDKSRRRIGKDLSKLQNVPETCTYLCRKKNCPLWLHFIMLIVLQMQYEHAFDLPPLQLRLSALFFLLKILPYLFITNENWWSEWMNEQCIPLSKVTLI